MAVSAAGQHWVFPLEDEPRLMVIESLDAIELTRKGQERITAFRTADAHARPWAYLGN